MTDEREFPTREPVEVRVTDRRITTDDATGEGDAREEAVVEEPSELDTARSQAASHLEDLQRLKAEFDNYRKRMTREQTALVERASEAVVERLLPVLDNFELALIAADRGKDYESLAKGVDMVYAELWELLQKEGLQRIDALGQAFDPILHEAVMRAEGEGELVVVEQMRPGYVIGSRVVRPAMVKVGPRSNEPRSKERREET